MDISEIKRLVLDYRRLLKSRNVTPDVLILFGSQARGSARPDSDIDLAVVSRCLGKDRFKEGVRLNKLARQIDPRFEVIPIGIEDYLQKETLSPILHEIKKTGLILF